MIWNRFSFWHATTFHTQYDVLYNLFVDTKYTKNGINHEYWKEHKDNAKSFNDELKINHKLSFIDEI